ncbi:Ppx/GppA phosphatase family protein [Lysinibacter cavernae]|uniref:Exopolyphosphatase/guanosine-5'-triphosphate, 3'-diphosphate pyrophosphatase n=1 Tax=Lysinibacter cavernae TaxID=1640652 RepID=A0A7X5R2I3_9MICO|nr:exopolyphosphatase [Lysinibacter cavernae]NIH54227.1 exopolyphosphatase/guanosine-5'-triphosphate,3'-diphosphate pyrophosphatase [Lysinibacter cavernae]
MTTVAAIDCGTNSIRLLIAKSELQADGTWSPLVDIVRDMRVVRLGYGVDKTGEFAPEALVRTLEATRYYAELIQQHSAERVRFVATSATRDARNRDEFIAGVHEALGIDPEVISGDEEADLSFRGAVSVVDSFASATDSGNLGAPYLVADLGGGSTEVVLGTAAPEAAFSMDIGSVRLTERHQGITDADARLAAVTHDIHAALDVAERHVDLSKTATLIGVAGTVTTVTAHALRLPKYDPAAINGATIPTSTFLDACDELASLHKEALAALPYMHPGRVDIIGVGATIWGELIRRVSDRVSAAGGQLQTVTTSEHDILDGIALSLLSANSDTNSRPALATD